MEGQRLGREGGGGGGSRARVRRGSAHKMKQATAKHLALLASLGRLGLSEHMRLEVDCRRWNGVGGGHGKAPRTLAPATGKRGRTTVHQIESLEPQTEVKGGVTGLVAGCKSRNSYRQAKIADKQAKGSYNTDTRYRHRVTA